MFGLIRVLNAIGFQHLEFIVAHCEMIEMDNRHIGEFAREMRYRGVIITDIDCRVILASIKGGTWVMLKVLTEKDLRRLCGKLKNAA